MRRSTPDCAFLARTQRSFVEDLPHADVVRFVAALEGFATEERRGRLRSVIEARLDSVTVVMDSPHDPHNGAAVVRSCDAFGVQRLHVVERREGFLSANSVSRGSERWVDVKAYKSAQVAIEGLRRSGFELVATHPLGELAPDDLAELPRVALVLGNERDGIAGELRNACRRAVRIPMRGFAESLNVSVTAAILLHHATAGRPGDLTVEERDRLLLRALFFTLPRAPDLLAAQGLSLPAAATGAGGGGGAGQTSGVRAR
jgi:tRNA (guanosine-2'-O-)-methyltransferase